MYLVNILFRKSVCYHVRCYVQLQCCPGYVDTDMTSHKGNKTIDQGRYYSMGKKLNNEKIRSKCHFFKLYTKSNSNEMFY